MLARTAPGSSGSRPALSSACSRFASASETSEQAGEQRVRAEAAVAHADRVLVAERLRELVVGRSPSRVKRGDADPVVVGRPQREAGEAVDRGQAGVQAGGERALARLDASSMSRASQAAASATAPITFGEPAS